MSKAKILLAKAKDDLELVKTIIGLKNQHDNAGYHLCQACEKILKALCEVRGLTYSTDGKKGHDLDRLLTHLEEDGMSEVSSFEDIIALTVYDAQARYDYLSDEERLDLKEYLAKTVHLAKFALQEFAKGPADKKRS